MKRFKGTGSFALKRLLDIIGATIGLIFLSPIILILAYTIRRKLGTPIFFCQTRPGLDCHPFRMVKFRTMRDAFDAQGQPLPDKDRVTPLGRFLRASSLDELPELWNVLKGDMSLVGPRPLLTEYLEYYTEEERLRHSVRPGITGWAQVNGRNVTTWDKRLQLDIEYVRDHHLWMDIKIIFLTLRQVIVRQGVVVVPSEKYQKLNVERKRND